MTLQIMLVTTKWLPRQLIYFYCTDHYNVHCAVHSTAQCTPQKIDATQKKKFCTNFFLKKIPNPASCKLFLTLSSKLYWSLYTEHCKVHILVEVYTVRYCTLTTVYQGICNWLLWQQFWGALSFRCLSYLYKLIFKL